MSRVREELGPDYDIKTHFTPRYNPWNERLCAVPDADIFAAIHSERAQVVTGHIDHFTAEGIALKSGKKIPADIVVLVTGLKLKFLGGIELTVDGEAIDPATHFVYRGMVLSTVPNLVQAFGYTNASWTLKADLTAEYVCRILNHLKKSQTTTAVATLAAGSVTEEPMLDFSSGYVQQSVDGFPKQGVENTMACLPALFSRSLQPALLKFDPRFAKIRLAQRNSERRSYFCQ